jgi:hypothetical protein
MPWDEFCTLVSGLMSDTPLGAVVAIRSEKDQKTIKAFTPDQRRIYREWRNRQAMRKLADPQQAVQDVQTISKMIAAMFGGKGGGGDGGR